MSCWCSIRLCILQCKPYRMEAGSRKLPIVCLAATAAGQAGSEGSSTCTSMPMRACAANSPRQHSAKQTSRCLAPSSMSRSDVENAGIKEVLLVQRSFQWTQRKQSLCFISKFSSTEASKPGSIRTASRASILPSWPPPNTPTTVDPGWPGSLPCQHRCCRASALNTSNWSPGLCSPQVQRGEQGARRAQSKSNAASIIANW